MNKKLMNLTWLIMGAIILSACQPNANLKLRIQSSSNLNQNELKQSLPVVMKVYQLSDSKIFNEATFKQLWKQDKATLGNSLISFKEILIGPKSCIEIVMPYENKAKFVGIVATFRNIKSVKWREIKNISSGLMGPKIFKISIQNDELIVE